ncbi:MAG: Fic family protein [Nitrospiria bacterium]
MSAFFERHRKEYYRLLLAVSQSGRWAEWITFFLQGVVEQSGDAVKRSNHLLAIWQGYRKKLQEARTSALLLQLVDELFRNPAITINRASKLLNITPRAAQLNVEKLIKAGILREATGRQRNRIFLATEIVNVIEALKA